MGAERGVDPAELTKLVQDTLASARLAPEAVAGVFSLDVKSDEPAVHSAAQALDVPARFFSAEILEQMTPRLVTPSAAVYRAVGCHGVAEGAALAAAGSDGTLILPKRKSARATCAVAVASEPIDPDCAGHPRGKLLVVGTGPGSSDWMTAECEAALASASDWVGYSRYIDLLGRKAKDKTLHAFDLGEERKRVAKALDLAAQGLTTALISSGDPGIYAMASLVFELIDSGEKPEWLRVEIEVCPGVSALQAAAARIGAPLGHDFCTVSLSDLLTDWTTIEKRIEAAAAGDFVVVFYNPVSSKRRWQLEKARTVLRRKRPASTPVVIGRNLGRDGESVRLTTLENLKPGDADMLTVIIVGSSQTRISHAVTHQKWVYTPRGYSDNRPGRIVEPDQATPLPDRQHPDLK